MGVNRRWASSVLHLRKVSWLLPSLWLLTFLLLAPETSCSFPFSPSYPESPGRNLPQTKRACCCSVARLCLTLWPHGLQVPLSSTISRSLLKFISVDLVMLSNHFIIKVSQHQGLLIRYCIGASALILLVNIQVWFPLGLTGLIPLLSRGLLRVFSITIVWQHQFFSAQPSLSSTSHIRTWLLEKP